MSYLILQLRALWQRAQAKWRKPDDTHYIWLPLGKPSRVRMLLGGAKSFAWLIAEWYEGITEAGGERSVQAIQRVARVNAHATSAWVASVGGLTRATAAVNVAASADKSPTSVYSVTSDELRAARPTAGNVSQVASIFLPGLSNLLELDIRTLSICHPDDFTIPG